MKRLLSFIVIFATLSSPITYAAPNKVTPKPLKLITTLDKSAEIAGVVVAGKTLIIYGNVGETSFARALDANGKELWNIPLDPNSPSVATTAGLDGAGNIWIAGSTSQVRAPVLPTPTSTPLNPDNILSPPEVFSADLKAVALWKIPSAGATATLFSLAQPIPTLITSLSIDKNGISLSGIRQSAKGHTGFLISADFSGTFGKPLIIGTESTTLDAVVRHSDGTLTATGASAETLGGKKAVGIIDGAIIKISKNNTLLSVLRSSAKKAKRNWNSASSNLLLGGEVITGAKVESAITKFTNSYIPSWTYRFESTGPVFTIGATYAAFVSTGVIPQLSNWKPRKPQPVLLVFNNKGVITSAFSGANNQGEIIALTDSKELGVIVLTSSAAGYSIFTTI